MSLTPEALISKTSVAGLSKLCSNVALGFMPFADLDDGGPVLDRFIERGGNVFDTAWVYGMGTTEKLFGAWVSSRGCRDEIVLIGKGAHTPECIPEAIGRQLTESLDRLCTDSLDMYFMHRDDPQVPVGEFVDAISVEFDAGRIRGVWGGSNWTMARLDEAIAYAEENGRVAPKALSNNFSLAEMVDSVWPGCISCRDDPWTSWLTTRGLTNIAWSSQSRGFFTERAGRDVLDDEELVRCWYSADNFGRRDRAVELAAQLGVDPIHVALAYVVAQPFSQIPIIGPSSLDELNHSLRAFQIQLTDEQCRWLDGSNSSGSHSSAALR